MNQTEQKPKRKCFAPAGIILSFLLIPFAAISFMALSFFTIRTAAITTAQTVQRTAGVTPPSRFAAGDRVISTTNTLIVRLDPSPSAFRTSTVSRGTYGTVVGGPVTSGGVIWWEIIYDTNATGWSSQSYLNRAPISSSAPRPSTQASGTASSHLRYFGYNLSDPRDVVEIAPYSNLATVKVSRPDQDITATLDLFARHDVSPVLDIDSLLYVTTLTPNCTLDPWNDRRCATTALRPDYRNIWSTFVQTNHLSERTALIGAIYVKDEPQWNNLPVADLDAAATLIKQTLPGVTTLSVEGWPSVARFQMPASIDWVGFDSYAIRTPDTNAYFRGLWNLMKTRKLASQKIMVVMDGAWRANLQGVTNDPRGSDIGNLRPGDMGNIAESYYRVAAADPDVVAIGVHLYESGIMAPDQLGSRDLPEALAAQRRIGQLITGRAAADNRQQILTQLSLPDLFVDSLGIVGDQNPAANANITFKVTAENRGPASAPSSIARYAIRREGLPGQPGNVVTVGGRAYSNQFSVPQLAAGDNWSISAPFRFTEPGRYYVNACLDSDNRVAETNEANNCDTYEFSVTASPTTVPAEPLPAPAALPTPTITAVTPSSVTALQSVTFIVTGQNFDSGTTVIYSGPTTGTIVPVLESPTRLRVYAPGGLAFGTYSFFVKNSGGRQSNSLSVAVATASAAAAPAPSLMTISPSNAIAGQSVTFTITGMNFQSIARVFYSGASSGTLVPTSVLANTLTLSTPTGLAAGTYSFIVVNPDGQSSNALAVTVTSPAVAVFIPTCAASFSPNTVNSGQGSQVTWSQTGDADNSMPYSCTGNLGSGTLTGTSGSFNTIGITSSQTCTLTVQNSSGTNTCQAAVNVRAASVQPSCSISFAPPSITAGQLTIASWSANNSSLPLAYSCTGNIGSGTLGTSSGTLNLIPKQSQTCTMTVQNGGNSGSCTASITVNTPSFNSSHPEFNAGFISSLETLIANLKIFTSQQTNQ